MRQKRQFALWTLFTIVFLSAVTMTVVVRLIQIAAQQEVVRQVVSAGGDIYYQFPFRFIVALRLDARMLSEEDVAAIGELKRLRRLTMSECEVPEDFEWLTQLKRLRSLDVEGTKLTENQVSVISTVQTLSVLGLSKTDLNDQGLAKLSSLERLYSLSIKSNPISDESLSTLKQMERLQFLDIRGTQITAAGLQQLQAALPDCKIKS